MVIKAPDRITYTDGHSFCPGCGHGTAIRLIGEVLQELKLEEDSIIVLDVACGGMPIDVWRYDTIEAAHGRPVPTAVGVKMVRPDQPVLAYLGDGAAYSIGIAETIHSARRNDNIAVIVLNNCVFGMTGGQMSPTTLQGQVTTSSPDGKNMESGGATLDVVKLLSSMDIAYLARGAICDAANIRKAKKYIKKAIEKQMNQEGFSLVELLSPCPTNWKMAPSQCADHIKEHVIAVFQVGEFIGKEGEQV